MKKNTAGQRLSVVMLSLTTGAPVIGASVSVRRNLDGVDADVTGTVSEPNSDGKYVLALSQADTNGNCCSYTFSATGCVSVCLNIHSDMHPGVGAVEYTHTVETVAHVPIPDATVRISTDEDGDDVIWAGVTDNFGVSRDTADELPMLDPGTYYFWVTKAGMSFSNPSVKEVG